MSEARPRHTASTSRIDSPMEQADEQVLAEELTGRGQKAPAPAPAPAPGRPPKVLVDFGSPIDRPNEQLLAEELAGRGQTGPVSVPVKAPKVPVNLGAPINRPNDQLLAEELSSHGRTAPGPAPDKASKVLFDFGIPVYRANEQWVAEELASRGQTAQAPAPAPDKRSGRKAEPVLVETSQEKLERAIDMRVIGDLTLMRETIVKFVERYFDFITKGAPSVALVKAPPELVRYIGCIAMGGPKGREGWVQLIDDAQWRKALVYGIVSQALQHHVLSSLYFGGSKTLIRALEKMEQQNQEDGTRARTQTVAKFNADLE